VKYSREFLIGIYTKMLTIRQFEERVKLLFLEGVMPGTIHQCQGQEATAVGVCSALNNDDVITSTHRPHGHCIAKGLPVNDMMAELFGRTTGCCKGKGGSMHMGDLSRGIVPAIAIVGGGIPVATGCALAFKLRKEARVAVCFMGDGATNEGVFHESLTMGAMNMVANLSEKARTYGMPGLTIDGNDPLAVYEATQTAAERARNGEGPSLLELMTYRITGHSRRDPALYQPEEEKKAAKANEPIGRFAKYLLTEKVAGQAELDLIAKGVDDEIETSVKFALASPFPKPEDTLEDLFVEPI